MGAFVIPAVSAGIGLAKSAWDWFDGESQSDKAAEMEANLSRPGYKIPESDKAALASAKAQAGMRRLPNQSAIEGRLDQTTASKIAMLERLGSGGPTTINAASRAYGQQMDAENRLGEAAGDMYLRNQDIYRDELRNMGNQEMNQWNWDERMPYEQKAASIMALKEAGLRNKRSARDNMFGVANNLMMGMDFSGFGSGQPASGGDKYAITIDPYQQPVQNVSAMSDPNYGKQTITTQRKPMWDSWDWGGIRN